MLNIKIDDAFDFFISRFSTMSTCDESIVVAVADYVWKAFKIRESIS